MGAKELWCLRIWILEYLRHMCVGYLRHPRAEVISANWVWALDFFVKKKKSKTISDRVVASYPTCHSLDNRSLLLLLFSDASQLHWTPFNPVSPSFPRLSIEACRKVHSDQVPITVSVLIQSQFLFLRLEGCIKTTRFFFFNFRMCRCANLPPQKRKKPKKPNLRHEYHSRRHTWWDRATQPHLGRLIRSANANHNAQTNEWMIIL